MKMVAENPGNITSWLTDRRQYSRCQCHRWRKQHPALSRKEGEPFKNTHYKFQRKPCSFVFTFDNKKFIRRLQHRARQNSNSRNRPAQWKELKLIFDHKDVDVSSMDYSKYAKCSPP
ncbi:MAG: hypothetical protein IPL35_12330 [Sphingobacteriales bacterium]|nr:hypothetical protein [Sphingobacteriales bacterium]